MLIKQLETIQIEHEDEIKELRRKFSAELDEKLADYKRQIDELMVQLTQTQNDLKLANKEKEDYRLKYEEQVKIVKQRDDTIQENKEQFKRESKEYKKEIKLLKEQVRKLTEENEYNIKTITDLNQKIDTLEQTHHQEIEYKNKRIDELLIEIQTINREVDAQKRLVDEKENKINLHLGRISQLEFDIEYKVNTIKELNIEITRLQELIRTNEETARENFNTLNVTYIDVKSQIVVLTNQINQLKAENARIVKEGEGNITII